MDVSDDAGMRGWIEELSVKNKSLQKKMKTLKNKRSISLSQLEEENSKLKQEIKSLKLLRKNNRKLKEEIESLKLENSQLKKGPVIIGVSSDSEDEDNERTTSLSAISNSNNNIMSPPVGLGMKRVNKPTITVAELRNQVGRDPPKMARSNSASSMLPPHPAQHQQMIMPRNPAAGAAIQALNAAAAGAASASGKKVIVNQNGQPYRVLNQSGIPKGMQRVSSSAGYHLVSPQGQSRPVVFQQAGSGRQISPTQAPPGFRPSVMQQQQQRTIPPPNLVVTTRAPTPNQMMNGNPQFGQLPQRPLQSTPPRTFALPILPAPTTPMVQQRSGATKDKPPQPELTLQEQDGGIVLSWTHKVLQNHAEIQSYQIFACQQPLNPIGTPLAPAWKRVGDVKALPLPMACTLTQFSDINRYHFIVRGLDVYNRSGPFCETVSIVLRKKR